MAKSKRNKNTTVIDANNSLGVPVFLEPSNPHAILNNLVARSAADSNNKVEPETPTTRILKEIIHSLAENRDISKYEDHIERVTANLPEKTDILSAYITQANAEFMADLMVIRQHVIQHIKKAIKQNDITTSEALVVWKMVNDILPVLQEKLGLVRPVNGKEILTKIQLEQREREESLRKKLEGTTPHGRELIRKKLWELAQTVDKNKTCSQKEAQTSGDSTASAELGLKCSI